MQPKESKSNSHFRISIVKSIIRIVGCYFLFIGNLPFGAVLFGLAEVLGILEEII
jgi:hypothetical protein